MNPNTQESEILTVRLDKGSKRLLSDLAVATDRSKSYLAAEAIRQYLELQNWQVEGIQLGLQQAKEGKFAETSKVDSLLKKFSDQ